MAEREKADLKMVSEPQQAALDAIEAVAKQSASIVQRLASHRDRVDLALKELESERFEIISRRDHLRRQVEAVESGFAMHLDDIAATLSLYESGLKSRTTPQN